MVPSEVSSLLTKFIEKPRPAASLTAWRASNFSVENHADAGLPRSAPAYPLPLRIRASAQKRAPPVRRFNAFRNRDVSHAFSRLKMAVISGIERRDLGFIACSRSTASISLWVTEPSNPTTFSTQMTDGFMVNIALSAYIKRACFGVIQLRLNAVLCFACGAVPNARNASGHNVDLVGWQCYVSRCR